MTDVEGDFWDRLTKLCDYFFVDEYELPANKLAALLAQKRDEYIIAEYEEMCGEEDDEEYYEIDEEWLEEWSGGEDADEYAERDSDDDE